MLGPPEPRPAGNLRVVGWYDPIWLPGTPKPPREPIYEGEVPLIIQSYEDLYARPEAGKFEEEDNP
jgi:hypothetical protein